MDTEGTPSKEHEKIKWIEFGEKQKPKMEKKRENASKEKD